MPLPYYCNIGTHNIPWRWPYKWPTGYIKVAHYTINVAYMVYCMQSQCIYYMALYTRLSSIQRSPPHELVQYIYVIHVIYSQEPTRWSLYGHLDFCNDHYQNPNNLWETSVLSTRNSIQQAAHCTILQMFFFTFFHWPTLHFIDILSSVNTIYKVVAWSRFLDLFLSPSHRQVALFDMPNSNRFNI